MGTETPAPQGPRFGGEPAEGTSNPTTTSTPKAAVCLGRMSVEIIFTSHKGRQQVDQPPPLPDTARVSSIKISGVTISNRLSVSQHVQNVVMLCAQTVHAPVSYTHLTLPTNREV